MRIAAVISLRGTCERAAVGAVISREGRVISTGYVGAPAGLPHCISVGCQAGVDGGCTRTVHAEANAIAVAARFGTGTDGSELHCTHSPCLACAKLIVNAGIKRLVYEEPYRDPSGLALLTEARIAIERLKADPQSLSDWVPGNEPGLPPEPYLPLDPRDAGWTPVADPGWPPQGS